MMNLFASVTQLQALLDSHGIGSIVIGGIAVAAWGEPRLTRDVDLKVLSGRNEASTLIEILLPKYQILSEQPEAAIRKQALLFIRDRDGTRLDLLIADTPYDIHAVRRGTVVEISPGIRIRVCSPEDLIIYKLISTRQRDYEDARSVINRQQEILDDEYTLHWLKQFEQALDDSTLVSTYRSLRGI
jgi:hypothetical protein